MSDERDEFERLNASLLDAALREEYRRPLDGYRPSLVPRMLGGFLVACGNLVYGERPSYQKFRAVEVIARVPYHSWASAAFTLLTAFYADERRALKLMTIARFARFASDNETMHVVVVSKLACAHEPAGFFRFTLIPMVFAFFYFWMSYWLYLLSPRYALETNYLFESHAFEQYSRFLDAEAETLKHLPIESAFLAAYGRHPRSEYDFFEMVRNDELIHLNRSIHEIEMNCARGR
jgi:hypothetical protein